VLQAAHVGGQTGLESRFVPWRAVTRHRLLEIVVEEFIRIVLGRVGRQIAEFDPVGMVVHPSGDPVGAMDRQIVNDPSGASVLDGRRSAANVIGVSGWRAKGVRYVSLRTCN
jgi:hypothetical protein